MTQRRLIDTNLIVRYLVQDHETHARAAERLFESCDRGDAVIVILPVVLAECVFVLDSFYDRSRRDIASALSRLISSPNVEVERRELYLDAFDRYARTKIHFVDCILAANAAADGLPIATFDRDFRKFPDIRVQL